jgi:hypothetical protein
MSWQGHTSRSSGTSSIGRVVQSTVAAFLLGGTVTAVSDDLSDLLDEAVPRCPRCLVLFDVEDDALPYLECPVCGDIWL